MSGQKKRGREKEREKDWKESREDTGMEGGLRIVLIRTAQTQNEDCSDMLHVLTPTARSPLEKQNNVSQLNTSILYGRAKAAELFR